MIRLEAADLLARYDRIQTRKAARYQNDPLAWLHDHMDFAGDAPAEYQERILNDLFAHSRVAVRAPRGSGKTTPAAWALLHFANTRTDDWKVPTTAGSWLQLSKFLWPEVHKWAKRLRWDRLGRDPYSLRTELLQLRLSLPGGEAFAINSDQPSLLEGAHARSMLAIVDEGKAVPDASWDAIEGYFSDPGEKRVLALSVPGAPAGRFYDICTRRPGLEDWHPIHVTIDQAVAAGRVRPEWVAQRRQQWGEDSALFKNHVLAEFGGEEDGVIPLSWVEAAVDRWRTLLAMPAPEIAGVDVADEGADRTVVALRAGDVIVSVKDLGGGDTMLTAERVALYGCEVVVDSIGVGAGVLARLRQLLPGKVSGFVASERSDRKDRTGEFGFINKRAAAWWNLRELLEPPSELCLPDDPMLLGDLTAPRWREVSGGKIGIEAKDDIRKRLGRSTDYADSVAMAMFDGGPSPLDGWMVR
jgi:hypothetical protein